MQEKSKASGRQDWLERNQIQQSSGNHYKYLEN